MGDYGTQFGKMIVAYRRWGNREDVINEPIKTLLEYYKNFHIEALLLSPSGIHTIKHLTPVAAFCSACTCIQFKDGIVPVILTG